MSIFPRKVKGVPTGDLIVEVMVDGKRTRKLASNMREAKRLEALMRLGGSEDAPGRAGAPLTVSGLQAKASELWHGTKDEANSIRRLVKVCGIIGPETLVRDITTSHLDKVREALRAEGLSDATLNRYSAAISKALEWAVKRDYLARMPEITWFKEPLRKFAWLEGDQEARLLAWLREPGNVSGDLGSRLALIYQVLIITGVRVGELLTLQADDVDPEAETITLWDTKNGSSRTQFCPTDLAQALKDLKTNGLFPQYHTMRKVLGRARKSLGFDPTLTIHSLRHSTATRLVLAGTNHKLVMDYMGHKSAATTNRYVHLNANAKAQVARQVFLGGKA